MSVQLQDAVAVIRTIGHRHHASEKLAKFLLSQDAKGTNRLTLTMNHQEIAEILGTSRETVTRMFTEFKKGNLIVMRGTSISIRNRAAMQRLLGA